MKTSGKAARNALWRMHTGMAVFWIVALGLMYVAMDRYLQPAASMVTADGSLQLQRHRNGHFYVDGSVNGHFVRFMVDTGATSISVTDELAEQAGLEGGEKVQFRTANGTRTGRLVRAQSIEVGPFQARNLTVGTGYTGSSAQDALLGQNFLRNFDVVMRNDTLELHPRR